MNRKTETTNLVISAALLALGMILPFFTGQIPQIGSRISPMHFPVLICGFVCGWKYGLAVGFILPLLRSLTFGMPSIMPTAAAMAVELAVYGALSGGLYQWLPKKNSYIYVALIMAMLLGRVAWGIASVFLWGVNGGTFTLQKFITAGFINAVPAILLQILLIPCIVMALKNQII